MMVCDGLTSDVLPHSDRLTDFFKESYHLVVTQLNVFQD